MSQNNMTFERESVGVCCPEEKLLKYQGFCWGWEETNSKEIENCLFGLLVLKVKFSNF